MRAGSVVERWTTSGWRRGVELVRIGRTGSRLISRTGNRIAMTSISAKQPVPNRRDGLIRIKL